MRRFLRCEVMEQPHHPHGLGNEQVKSCVDYAHDSWAVTFLSGALNYQVTHHLFPGVSQVRRQYSAGAFSGWFLKTRDLFEISAVG